MAEVRNPVYTADGVGIDCEVNHPRFSWVPYTARPDDPAAYGPEIYAAALALGPAPYVAPPPPPPPTPPTPEELEAEVQSLADEIVSASSALDDRLWALAQATIDMRLADVTGFTRQQVATAFRDRVVFYLRQRRGI